MSPDIRQHRGAHPADKHQFGTEQLSALRSATSELSWLLTRGYKVGSALKLVGDRYGLTARQRLAISRAACSDQSRDQRRRHCVPVKAIENEKVIVDGFNLIITVEAALSSGVLLCCRDDCIRDLSSVHGSYRSVQETNRAILVIGEALKSLGPTSVLWLLDRPVSNSGRLAQKIREIASRSRWPWEVKLEFNPDKEILSSLAIAVTSDSSILDGVSRWANLGFYLLERSLPRSRVLDLRDVPPAN